MLISSCRPLALAGAVAAGILPGATATAQTWTETGDAGELIGTAQVTTGTGSLTSIQGTLASTGDVDMYCIRIDDDVTFVARRLCATISEPDIWLFDAAGNGVSMHDGCQGGDTRVTGLYLSGPGVYYVAISGDAAEAMNAGDVPIWAAGPSSPERSPDGAGAPGPLSHWSVDNATLTSPNYEILLQAVSYCSGPVPIEGTSWGRLKGSYR